MDLKEKCKRLEEERKLIDERLENSQLEMVTQKNNLNSLLEQLKAQKKINMNQAQRLQIINEQLEILQSDTEKTVGNIYLYIHFLLLCQRSYTGYFTITTSIFPLIMVSKVKKAWNVHFKILQKII